MPFLVGRAPVRRTMNYLNKGILAIKEPIKIMTLNYNKRGDHNEGAKDFEFWFFPQIQFKNPHVQIISLTNLTPTPFIQCFFENGKDLVLDIDGKTKQEILDLLVKVIGKTIGQQKEEKRLSEKGDNPAHFGAFCERPCICVIPGQVPCPGVVPLPDHMRAKFKLQKDD